MSRIDRRDFLRLAAQSTTGAAALAALPPLLREALALPAASATGSINDVEHVVIFMQENRSLDHYYGSIKGVRGFSDRTPIPLPNGRDAWHQPYNGKAEGYLLPHHLDTRTSSAICASAPAMPASNNLLVQVAPLSLLRYTPGEVPPRHEASQVSTPATSVDARCKQLLAVDKVCGNVAPPSLLVKSPALVATMTRVFDNFEMRRSFT